MCFIAPYVFSNFLGYIILSSFLSSEAFSSEEFPSDFLSSSKSFLPFLSLFSLMFLNIFNSLFGTSMNSSLFVKNNKKSLKVNILVITKLSSWKISKVFFKS